MLNHIPTLIRMKIIFSTLFGSHLYGTSTVNSDHDFKGIFISPLSDIILRRDVKTVHQNTKASSAGHRNISTDVDIEYKELREFIKDCMEGQTYALDMIFAPTGFWSFDTEPGEEWLFIQENKHRLLSKNVQPYIGYVRQQTGKYGLKGSRLGELLRVIAHLETFDRKLPMSEAVKGLALSEFVTITNAVVERTGREPLVQDFLEVLGKKFDFKRQIGDCLDALNQLNKLYGSRAKLAQENQGVDWKAVSHAFRICHQLIELAETKNIAFPLREAEYIKRIKLGEIPYVQLQDKLSQMMEYAISAVAKSDLPEEPEKEFWEKWMVGLYSQSGVEQW